MDHEDKPAKRRFSDSLAVAFPALEAEWDYARNGKLLPTEVTPGSSKKVWWTCATCGYSWEAIINNRTKKGSGCPACSGRVARVGQNDVATLYPQLMLDWDTENNEGLDPSNLLRTNNVRINWKCHTCGTQWQSSLVTRTMHDSGCPTCRERERVERGNLLAIRFPDMVAEWDFAKNLGIDIMTVAQYSDMKVWWRCRECGHEYQTKVRYRTNGHSGCPQCAERKAGQRLVESFVEQGMPVRIGITYDVESGQVFSGLGRCGCIRVYEPVGPWDASCMGLAGEELPACQGQPPALTLVEEIDTTNMKREGITRELDKHRVTHFITGELGGNAMNSLAVIGTLCFYDVQGSAEERMSDLMAGQLHGKRLERAKVQRI